MNLKFLVMKKAFIENLYSGMMVKLEEINGTFKDPAEHLNEALCCIHAAITDLRAHVRRHPFEADQEEIKFFKYTKPRICGLQTYIVERHRILSSVPVSTDQEIRAFYEEELRSINRIFRLYPFQYQYYRTAEDGKDRAFFLRRNRSPFPPGRELLPSDPDFSTELDHLFMLFGAYEKLRDFLIRRIRLSYKEANDSLLEESMKAKERRWVGTKVELVELAYGLYLTKRINDGKAEISDIVAWLEESFQVDLAQVYRMFADIARRKSTSYTKYIDEMGKAVCQHIERPLTYRH